MIISTFFKNNNPNPNPIPIYRIRIRIRSRISKRREEKRRGVERSHQSFGNTIQNREEKKEFQGVFRCFQEKEQKKKVMHIHSRQLTHTTCNLKHSKHYIHYINKETQKEKKKKEKEEMQCTFTLDNSTIHIQSSLHIEYLSDNQEINTFRQHLEKNITNKSPIIMVTTLHLYNYTRYTSRIHDIWTTETLHFYKQLFRSSISNSQFTQIK